MPLLDRLRIRIDIMNDKEKIKKAAMSDGNYISSSDMKEIDGLCNSWWQESPYELKATIQ